MSWRKEHIGNTISPDRGLGEVFSEETAPESVYKGQAGFHYRKKLKAARRGRAEGHRRTVGVIVVGEGPAGAPTWQWLQLCTHRTEGEAGGETGKSGADMESPVHWPLKDLASGKVSEYRCSSEGPG